MNISRSVSRLLSTFIVTCAAFLSAATPAPMVAAQSLPPALYSGLQWRLIGPFRAGRVVAVSGVPGSHRKFFFGGVDGGVWKTTDAGTVWQPVFDHAPVASIGSIAVADSDPNIMYAGTGESDIRSDLASGDGVYRSDDAGSTWKHVGLADSQQISRILVDPNDANTVYAGVLGHAYGPSDERGVYKSTDGGSIGNECSTRDLTSALPISPWRMPSRTFFSLRAGMRIVLRGAPILRSKDPVMVSIAPSMAAQLGRK